MQEKKNETTKFSEPTDPRGFFLSKLDKAREKYISQTYVHHCVFSEFCF